MHLNSLGMTIAAVVTVLMATPVAAQQPPQPAPVIGAVTSGTGVPNRVGDLIEQMRAGGLVLVIRHERTEVPSREDDYTRPAHDCTAQRNLSVAGMAGAQETGFALRALNIPVTKVISGPMCRTTETARFMLGPYTTDPRLIHPNPGVPGGRDIVGAEAEFIQVLRELPSAGGNTALISHSGNIFRATGLRLAEGEIGVVRLRANGGVEPVGQVTGSDLGSHARLALAATPQ